MKLTQDQINKTENYLGWLDKGESKTSAAALVGVPRKTIARWAESYDANKPKTKIAKPVEDSNDFDPEYPRIKKLIVEQLGLSESDINYNSHFMNDLGADSLDGVEIVMAIEDDFDIEITDAEAESIKTVREAYELVLKKLHKNPSNKEVIKNVEKRTDEFVPFQSISLPNVFTIVRDGAPLQIDKSHQNFAKIKDIISNVKNGQILSSDLEKLYDLIDLKSSLAKFSHGRITVDDTGVKVDGKPLHNSLANILLKSFRDQDAASLTKFAKFHEKIMEAISYKVTHRLFDFVQGQGLRIDDDGDILAFKVVQNNYLDKHSGTFDNSPGKIVEMPRNQVDDDDTKECRPGLHVCSQKYIGVFAAKSGGDRLVEVKVDPRDFCSVPTDYGFSKARTCKYIVVRDISKEYSKELYNKE